ncbi:MAG: hypothetical protein COA84_15230 [Robiginitomaculum sp.]|nr:MAG: hypothetical protein COA84_15230 [Robiginitomaculum sp.]
MTKENNEDPFLVKLRAVIDARPEFTVAGLAVKAGLTNSAIRAMFSGRNQSPRLDTARKICEAMGTTLEEFMSDAQTSEEFEIVRLVSQLSVEERQQLLGFGKGLLASQNPAPPKSDEGTQ